MFIYRYMYGKTELHKNIEALCINIYTHIYLLIKIIVLPPLSNLGKTNVHVQYLLLGIMT